MRCSNSQSLVSNKSTDENWKERNENMNTHVVCAYLILILKKETSMNEKAISMTWEK